MELITNIRSVVSRFISVFRPKAIVEPPIVINLPPTEEERPEIYKADPLHTFEVMNIVRMDSAEGPKLPDYLLDNPPMCTQCPDIRIVHAVGNCMEARAIQKDRDTPSLKKQPRRKSGR